MMCVLTLSFLGMASSYGQKKSSVIISGTNTARYTIEIVQPDYKLESKEMDRREVDFLVALKQEVDIWLNQGYEIEDVTMSTIGSVERFLFVLIKEE